MDILTGCLPSAIKLDAEGAILKLHGVFSLGRKSRLMLVGKFVWKSRDSLVFVQQPFMI